MKKISFLVLVCIALLLIVGCDPNSFYYDKEEVKNTLASVELIYYDNNETSRHIVSKDEVVNFDFSKMTVLDVLQEERKPAFIYELTYSPLLDFELHYIEPKGQCVKINYTNEYFDVIGCEYLFLGKYDNEGNVLEVHACSCYSFKWFFEYSY